MEAQALNPNRTSFLVFAKKKKKKKAQLFVHKI